MNKKFLGILVCMLLFATGFSVAVTGNNNSDKNQSNVSFDTDWWQMLYHDAQRTSFSTSDGPETNNIMTEITNSNSNYPVTIYNDVLFSAGISIKAYDANNGFLLQDTFFSARSPMSVGNDRIVFAANTFGLVCLDTNIENWNNQIWMTPIGDTSFSSPVIVGDFVYFAQGISSITHITCFNLNDGSQEWDTSLDALSLSDIVIENNEIYITANQDLYCINDSDGDILWQTTVTGAGDQFGGVTPTIANDVLYTISLGGIIYALDLTNEGSILWQYATGKAPNFKDSPAIGYGYLYVGTNAALYCMDLSDPSTPAWTYNFNNQPASTPIVADEKVYVRLSGLRCLNAYDGNLIWTDTKTSTICPVIVNGILYYVSGSTIYFYNENTAPNTPTFDGPNEAEKNIPISFYANGSDPDGGDVYYMIDWIGNGQNYEEFGPYPSGVEQEITHIFSLPHYEGNMTSHIYCWTKDASQYEAISAIPAGPHNVFTENHAPNPPEIEGPSQAYAGEWFTLNFTVSDPDNDINLALGRLVYVGSPPSPEWQYEGNYNSGDVVEKNYRYYDLGLVTFHFKVGERQRYDGQIKAESEEVIFTVDIIEKPDVGLEVGDLTATFGTLHTELIENVGEYPAENVEWTFTVTGGILGRVNIQLSGTIDEIPIDGSAELTTEGEGNFLGYIVGFGPINVNVSATANFMEEPVYKEFFGALLGPFIINIREL